jgi:di/tricarboxylate transporter
MSQLFLVLIAFVFLAVFLCWGKIPAALTCVISIVFLWATGVLSTQEAFGNFISNSVITMLAMMIVSTGLLKTNILINITNLITKPQGGGTRILLIVAIIVPFLLCQFMGGVGSLITVIPLLLSFAKVAKVPHSTLILPASVGGQFGITLLPIGLSATAFLQKNQILENLGSDFKLGFWDLAVSRLPGVLFGLAFIVFFGYKLLPKHDIKDTDVLEKNVVKKSELPKWKERAAYIIFCGTMLGMIFSRQLHMSLGMVASIGAILMVVTGIISQNEAFAGVSWSTLFMVACMLAMATALSNSGAGDFFAEKISLVIRPNTSVTVVVIICFLFCVIFTQFMDNGALINILTPLMILACMRSGINPLAAICAIEISSVSSIMTPMASPSSALTYSMGGYSIKQMVKFGMPVILIEFIVVVIWVPLYFNLIY